MSDAAQFNQPATQPTSPTAGQVAPPTFGQGQQVGVPGVPQQVQQGQPAQQPQGVAQAEQKPAQPTVDYQAELQREREARSREAAERTRLEGIVGQIQRASQDAQEQQAYDAELTMILATADNMPAAEAQNYIKNQVKNITGRERIKASQQIQQLQQTSQQQLHQAVAPQYADYVLGTVGLPVEAKEELLTYSGGNPERMEGIAKQIKARYDRHAAEVAQYQQNQTQVARTNEVNAMQNAGLTSFGGQNGGGSYSLDVSDDPDVAAMQVLNHLRQRERQAR